MPADIESNSLRTPANRTSGDAHANALSPALTVDTAADSPTSAAGGQTVTFEHKISTDGKKSKAVGGRPRALGLLGLVATKPGMAVMAIVVLLILTSASGGAAAWLRWFRIPGLQTQVDRLEAEVDRLTGQVDRLEQENDRFEMLNNQLNQTVEELEDITEDLNATATEFKIISQDLNTTNVELQVRVSELAAENELYQKLNNDLNNTAERLSAEVDQFQDALVILQQEYSALANVTARLRDVTLTLTNQTESQQEALLALESSLNDLSSENERLLTLTTNLQTVANFLNTTSTGLDASLTQVSQALADQILANQKLVLITIESSYRQRLISWECDYRVVFGDEDFGSDFTQTIPSAFRGQVLDYVDDRVLSELCLEPSDFDRYIREDLYATSGGSINTDQLIRGVLLYVEKALDYYFPEDLDGNANVILPADWVEASYECRALTPFLLFENAAV